MKFQLDHVGIQCENYEESKQFYQDLLGAKIIFESRSARDGYPFCLLYIGGEDLKGDLFKDHYAHSPLETIELLGQPPNGDKRPSGFSHVCYRIENFEDAYKLAKSKGVRFSEELHSGGGLKIAFFNGPSGERTEFFYIPPPG